MRYPLLATQLYGIPLLLHPEKAAVIETVFRSHVAGQPVTLEDFHKPEPVAAVFAASRFAHKPYAVTDAGVAVLPITGSLVQRASGLNAASGMQSYQTLERQFEQAAADPDVKAILMEMDSPGGQAAGVFELAKRIKEQCAAAGKPLWAHANEMALSAGYALAIVADKVLLPQTGMLGSIGVIALHVDQSKKNAKDGYAYTAISAGGKKALGSPHAPLSDEAKGEMQARVDVLYQHFIDHVAAMRGIPADQVRAQEAGVFSGQAAIDAGLADSIMSFNEALKALEAEANKPKASISTAAAMRQPTRRLAMSNPEQLAEMFSADQVAAQVAAARKEGAEQMQARIREISTSDEAKGREALAQHLAFSTSMSADEAKALLAVSAKEAPPSAASQVNALADAMAKLANPSVGADAPISETDPKAAVAALWCRSNQKLHAVK
jgi:signal peptide peptidase SppA